MSKQIGTIRNKSKTSGKLYGTQKIGVVGNERNTLVHHQFISQHDASNGIRKRTNSVGRIYCTNKLSENKDQLRYNYSPVKPYDLLINYQQVQNKLSNYLECTIQTNGRQKYNYLSHHYNQVYDTLSKNNNNFISRQLKDKRMDMNCQEKQNYFTKSNLNSRKQLIKQNINVQTRKAQENILQNKQNMKTSILTSKKQNPQLLSTKKKQNPIQLTVINHQLHKHQLQNKLKRLISGYQNKNKQLSMQMHKLEQKLVLIPSQQLKKDSKSITCPTKQLQDNPAFSEQSFRQSLDKLIEFNLQGISLSKECDAKLEEIWKSIHKQIIVDEQLRIIKSFINEHNINQVFTQTNANKIKKIELSALKIHSEEYDPFLVEKINQTLNIKSQTFAHKSICKWISERFIKFYQQSEKNWLKYLSPQKLECIIKSMVLEKEISGLRKNQSISKDLTLRDFTRYLSTIYKANLRNRNIYQIYNKLKNMSYVSRFIELLEQKAGKGADLRKFSSK